MGLDWSLRRTVAVLDWGLWGAVAVLDWGLGRTIAVLDRSLGRAIAVLLRCAVGGGLRGTIRVGGSDSGGGGRAVRVLGWLLADLLVLSLVGGLALLLVDGIVLGAVFSAASLKTNGKAKTFTIFIHGILISLGPLLYNKS